MINNFHKYIKAVGTGSKHNFNLSQDQMEDAMKQILNNEVYPEQLSAFLLGWRIKPETTDEFIGALKAFEYYIKREVVPNSIELGYPYDGKCNNPYLFSLIAKELEKFDLKVAVTGDELQPAKNGITLKQIVANLSLPNNLYYYDRKDIFPQLSNLTQIRNRLGTRTGFNTIERLLNPASSQYAFIGVFHKPFMNKYATMFKDKYKKLIIIKGNEGTSEIFSKAQYWIIENDNISEYKIDPKDFGINYTKSWDRISLRESLDIINNPSDELIKLVKLNAALILYITQKVKTIDEGYQILI